MTTMLEMLFANTDNLGLWLLQASSHACITALHIPFPLIYTRGSLWTGRYSTLYVGTTLTSGVGISLPPLACLLDTILAYTFRLSR